MRMKWLWGVFFTAAILFGCEGPQGDPGTISQGPPCDNCVVSGSIVDGTITSADIAGWAVTSGSIFTGAVTSEAIAGWAVTSGSIFTGAVTSEAIAGLAVTSGSIFTGAVTSGAIANGAVTSGAIANGAVTSGAIAGGAVTSGAIGSGAVTSGAIADGTITSADIADGAVTSERVVLAGGFSMATSDLTLTATAALVPGTDASVDVLTDQWMIATMTAGIEVTDGAVDACALYVDSAAAGTPAVLGGANITSTVSAIYVVSLSAGPHTIEMDCWTNSGLQGDLVLSAWSTGYTYFLFSQ